MNIIILRYPGMNIPMIVKSGNYLFHSVFWLVLIFINGTIVTQKFSKIKKKNKKIINILNLLESNNKNYTIFKIQRMQLLTNMTYIEIFFYSFFNYFFDILKKSNDFLQVILLNILIITHITVFQLYELFWINNWDK